MKIDPTDLSLYTDSGRFLKKLNCPLGKIWDAMKPAGRGKRVCDSCSLHVHDTSAMTDEELVSLLEKDPSVCLRVSPRQDNCTVMTIPIQKKG